MTSQYINPYETLFTALNANDIQWCSWKSRLHLDAGLEGKTDIDLLITTHNQIRVEQLMHECGFIRFEAPKHRAYPQIEDYIAIDPQSGKLLHAHTHYELTLGEKNLKSFILPWGKDITDRRIDTKSTLGFKTPIYISCPKDELLLLYIRESLKIRMREKILKKDKIPFCDKNTCAEETDLKNRISEAELCDHAKKTLCADSVILIQKIYNDGLNYKSLVNLKKYMIVLIDKKKWRRMGPKEALLRIWNREFLSLSTRALDKYHITLPFLVRRRVRPKNGLIIAFTGVDGSGKSTITHDIANQWREKIDVTHIYLGTGEGTSSFFLNILSFINKILKKIKPKIENAENKENKTEISANTSWKFIIWSLFSALDKQLKIKHITRLKNKGHFIICDRWPQNQKNGFNDGLMLSHLKNNKSSIKKYCAAWEEKQFNKICALTYPDIGIYLKTSLEDSIARKPEHAEIKDMISHKIQTLDTIKFNEKTNSHVVSTDKPLKNVQSEIYTIIGTHLQNSSYHAPKFHEYMGLPGAGKTTITQKIYEGTDFTTANDITFNDDESNLKYFVLSLILNPVSYLQAFRLSFTHKLWGSKTSLGYIFKLPAQTIKYDRLSKNQKIYADQLLLQNLWSAFVYTPPNDLKLSDLSAFINSLYHNFDPLIIYFDVSAKKATERLIARNHGHSRFDELNQEETLKKLRGPADNMPIILQAAKYAGLSIITVSSSDDIESTKSELVSEINIA